MVYFICFVKQSFLKILIYNFQTGDILLFDGSDWNIPFGGFSFLIKYFTNSDWSHIGMIVKDPGDFTKKDMPKGLYLWESSFSLNDTEDHEIKIGVQLTPLENLINNYDGIIHWRKLNPGNVQITNEKLAEIHNLVHGKPYDVNPIDWFDALIEYKSTRSDSRYFCSAFVSRLYSFLGLINPDIDWTIIRPSSFSVENPDDNLHIKMINGASLGPEIEIKNS